MVRTYGTSRELSNDGSKPYICQASRCNRRRFSDKGTLSRHEREVHGSNVYICPILSCNRNRRGFNRKHNLMEHMKRCHPQHRFNTSPTSRRRSQNCNLTSQYGAPIEDDETSLSPDATVYGHIPAASSGKLREELDRLRLQRVELIAKTKGIDSHIEGLESALIALGHSIC